MGHTFSLIIRVNIILLSFLIFIQVASAVGNIKDAPTLQIEKQHVILKRCKSFESQVARINTVYEVRHKYNLKNKTIKLPKGCTLVFNGGVLNNGNVFGDNTVIEYRTPFLNNVSLQGSFVTDRIPVDSEIFVDNSYSSDRIYSMLCIYGKGNKIMFSQNTYEDVETINLTRNADIDFSGSKIKLKLDQSGLPLSFIYIEEKSVGEMAFLDFFKLKNVTIIGNEAFDYDGTIRPKTTHEGKYRRCIQLFKVDDVEIDNVSFEHIEVGTAGKFHQDIRERYELSMVAVMYYNHVRINACDLHDCSGDNLINLIPNIRRDNMAIVSNCSSYRNFTGLLGIVDGRCKVFGNSCRDFNSSAMNLFVYESDIYDNSFENSLRSDCIDLSEDGDIAVHDVNIYNNKGLNIHVLCSICGDRINVHDNISESKGIFPLVMVDCTREPNASLVNNNVSLCSKRTAKIYNNTVKGGGIVSAVVNNKYNTLVRFVDTLYVENNICEKESENVKNYSHPIFLLNCRKAIIRGNKLKGLSKNPAGKGSASFICSYNVLSDESIFENDVEITGNELHIEVGQIGDNVLKSVYLVRNNREDRKSDVNLIIQDNQLLSTERGLRDVYISSPIRSKRINSERNKGFVRSADD